MTNRFGLKKGEAEMSLISIDERRKIIDQFFQEILVVRKLGDEVLHNLQMANYNLTKENKELKEQLEKQKKKK
jgi:hypothetical protein